MSSKQLDLPCGLEEPGARVVRSVEIHKIKGKLQRELAVLAGQKNPNTAEILDATLRLCLARIGGADVSSTLLSRLLLADRDWVIREAAVMLRGPTTTLSERCPKCPKDDNETEYPNFNLADLPVTLLGDDALWWHKGQTLTKQQIDTLTPVERDEIRFRCFQIRHEESGATGTFRYPTGLHQKAVASLGDRPVEALWKLMSMTCLAWSDPDNQSVKVGPQGVHPHFWDEVDLDILDWAQPAFAAAMPGVDTNADLTCKNGHDHKVQVALLGFLFRRPEPPG